MDENNNIGKYISLQLEKLNVLDEAIAKTEEYLSNLKEQRREIVEDNIPMRLSEEGLDKVDLDNGVTVSKQIYLNASIPSMNTILTCKDQVRAKELNDKREKGLNWLRANGFDDKIKNKLEVIFGKGQDKEANSYAKLLHSDGYNPRLEESCHPQTLSSLLKGQINEGKNIPDNTFNMNMGVKAVIKSKT